MKQINKLFFLFGLLLPFFTSAQDRFTLADSAFFAHQKPDMQAWLTKMGVDADKIQEIHIQTIPDYVVLRIYPHSLEKWFGLRESYRTQYQRSLEQDIFEKFVFLCEAEAKQVLIVIAEKSDSKALKYELIAGLDAAQNDAFRIEERNITRTPSIEKFKLPVAMLIPPTGTTSFDDLSVVRERVISILRKYYADKGTWFEQSKFEVKESIENQVKIVITNLKNEMLDDLFFGHFERIELRFNLKKESEKVIFECITNGKYGTSILTAPRSDYQYKDMGINYQDYIDNYALKIKNLLYNQLK